MDWNASTADASASERATGLVLARIPGSPDTWKEVAIADLLFKDASGHYAIGGVAANYRLTSYLAGANPNYLQVINGSTGPASANGLLIGVKGDGTAHLAMQGAFNLEVDVGGYNVAKFDYASGDFLMTANGGALGYASGAAATQTTSKSTAVSVNGTSVEVTMHNATLAADTAVSFTLTNTDIAANDTLAVNIKSGAASGGCYHVSADAISTDTARISVRNLTAGGLSEALVLQINILRGANA